MSLTNEHPDFYPLVGPWLSRRDIVGELGHPVWDDPGKRWFVAIGEGSPVGMCALTDRGDLWSFGSFWVHPSVRGEGVGATLLRKALAQSAGFPVTCAATIASVRVFGSAGFVTTGQRGRYTLMRREP